MHPSPRLGQDGGEMVTSSTNYQTFAFNPCFNEHSNSTCVDFQVRAVPA